MFQRLRSVIAFVVCTVAITPSLSDGRAVTPPDVGDLTADAALWRAMPSDGVEAAISTQPAGPGNAPCLRLDFNFKTGGGFVVVQRDLAIDLPENYEFAFNVKGDSKKNNLEFKLLDPPANNDPTTSSVWWVNKPAYEFSKEWTPVVYKRRHFTFAWGPSGGKPHTKLGKIEFAIASNQGGKGTIWFSGLTFRALPVVKPYTGTPTATATDSVDAEHGPEKAIDGDPVTAWYSTMPGSALTIDFGMVREFGGLKVVWGSIPNEEGQASAKHPYSIHLSAEGTAWTDAAVDWNGSGATDFLFMPDTEARFVKITARENGIAPTSLKPLAEVSVIPIEAASSFNRFMEHMANELPRGVLPRWASKEQSFWTTLGVPESTFEALINEEGQVEVGKGAFSIEPFVFDGESLLTWADGTHSHSLADGHLPIASVVRSMSGLRLEIRAGAVGPSDQCALALHYRLTNTDSVPRATGLALAVRPFQVNPPAQFLNTVGGASSIKRVKVRTDVTMLVGDAVLYTTTAADARGAQGATKLSNHASRTNETDVVASLLPTQERFAVWADRGERASGALVNRLTLEPGQSVSWGVVMPFEGTARPSWLPVDLTSVAVGAMLDVTEEAWKAELSRATLSLPPSAKAIEDTFYAQQAYILINKDGPGFQPGSRSYERSWMRDGSMTSAAMLQLGYFDLVKEFVTWYASFQFPDGKVPCVVDSRGPDPVPENDSHGELIMAIANVQRYTHDVEFTKAQFDHVRKAVEYIERLRAERMTAEFAELPGSPESKSKQEPGKPAVPLRAFYGLLPESISHEGYSAKPMHSYWDDLFAYRGLKDAAYLAGIVDDHAFETKWTALATDFGDTLAASYALAMKTHTIDYLPGCVELGDFDATSTTVALWPVQAQDILPHAALERTFDTYWDFFTHRRDNPRGLWEAYTPYELRTINAMVHLGQRDRAVAALEWFMRDQYPPGWHHWAEVVWSNPRTTKFIGDMPHTWVGSDFLNSLRSMFVYEDEAKDALVLFAGIPEKWVRESEGISFTNFRTYYGSLSAAARSQGDTITMTFEGNLNLPQGGLVIRSVLNKPCSSVLVDGQPVPEADGEITLHALPHQIEWRP